jgi:very-short-patch-repair endonuclease
MPDLTPAAMDVFRRHHGHATGEMLSRAGVGRSRRRRLLEAAVLEVVLGRVYRIRSAPTTVESMCAALSLAYPSGFITGPTAGRLLGLRRMGRADLVHFSVRHGSNIGPLPGVQLRQTTVIEPDHVQTRADGIRVASPARLAFDLAADLTEIDHASVVEQLLHDRRCSLNALTRVGRRLAHPARPGSMLFLSTLANRVSGGPLESHPEVVLAQALRSRGIPVIAQVDRLVLPNGSRIRIDLAVPELRWGIEIDAHGDHFLLEGGTKDRRRDRQCHLIGWQVERVTPLDLTDIDGLCDELAALYEARRRAVA